MGSLFMAVGQVLQNRNQTPLKKGPFFWFVFFGSAKKMNMIYFGIPRGLK